MTDEVTQAVTEAPEQAPGAEASPASEVEAASQQPQEPVTTQEPQAPEAEQASGEEKLQSSTEGKKKPSRAQRRIQSLIQKLKEKDKPSEGFSPVESQVAQQVVGPDLTPDEEGFVDINAVKEAAKQEAIREMMAVIQHREAAKEHITDIEQTLKAPELDPKSDKYDPDLDKLIAEEYEKVNKIVDPYTGQEVFVPREKMSDIYKRVKRVLDKYRSQGEQEGAEKVQKQQGVTAVSPSTSAKPDSEAYETQALFEKARQSGDTETWAEYLKRIGVAKVSQ